MAVMGLRLAGRSNGVAQLHGEVSRDMFGDLWPDLESDETPIGSITNGVHAHTWTSPEIADVLSRYVLPEWDEAGPDLWARITEAPDDELWRAREQGAGAAGHVRPPPAQARRRPAAASPVPTWPGPTRCSTPAC